MAFTAKDVQALRQATGAGMMDCEEGARGQRRRHRGRQAVAARAGPRRQRQARRPREHPGRRRPRGRRPGRRAGRAEVRDRLRRRQRALQARGPGARPPRRRQGRRGRRRAPGPPRGPQDHAQGEDRGRPRSCASRPSPATSIDSYLHIQGGRGVNGVLVVLAGGSPQLAHDVAVHVAFARPKYLAPRRRAGRRRRRPSARRSRRSPATRASPSRPSPKIVEGRLQRLLQDRRPARPALRQGRQAVDRAAHRLGARSSSFAQVEIG